MHPQIKPNNQILLLNPLPIKKPIKINMLLTQSRRIQSRRRPRFRILPLRNIKMLLGKIDSIIRDSRVRSDKVSGWAYPRSDSETSILSIRVFGVFVDDGVGCCCVWWPVYFPLVFVCDEGALNVHCVLDFVAAGEGFGDGLDVDALHCVCCAVDVEIEFEVDDVVVLHTYVSYG